MKKLIPLAVLICLPVPALADDTEECELEVHSDGFLEVEYENEATGAECEAAIPIGATPTADEQMCLAQCRALLDLVPSAEAITATDLCLALAEGRVDANVIATLPDGSTQTVAEFCAGPGGQAGSTIIVIIPTGSVTPRR